MHNIALSKSTIIARKCRFFSKNIDISKIKWALVLKGIFSETKCVCVLTYKFQFSSIILTSFRQDWGGGGGEGGHIKCYSCLYYSSIVPCSHRCFQTQSLKKSRRCKKKKKKKISWTLSRKCQEFQGNLFKEHLCRAITRVSASLAI